MKGVKAGETREAEAKLTDDAPNEALRGQEVTAVFEVLEVKKLELPELTPELLEELGGFEIGGRAARRDPGQTSSGSSSTTSSNSVPASRSPAALTEAANWELPPELLQRQSHRELERAVLELRRSGFSDEEIQAYENELRQNSAASTARALKEHFILERIAEEEKIEASRGRLRVRRSP